MGRSRGQPDELMTMHPVAASGLGSIVPLVNDSPTEDDPLVRLGRLALVGELSPGIAHEINNPLFAVLGLIEFLLIDVEAGSKAHQRLELVQATGLEIKDIVRSLVDFARARGDVDNAALDDAAARAAELARRTSLAKAVELTVEFPDAPLVTTARRSDLEQALLALLVRSMTAAGEPGRVAVELARDGADAVATVHHTGAPLELDVSGATLEPQQLVLAAAGRIARAYGGDLTATATSDGQTFTFRVPLA